MPGSSAPWPRQGRGLPAAGRAALSLVLAVALAWAAASPLFAQNASRPATQGAAIRIAAIYAASGEAFAGTAMQDFHGAALAVAGINAAGGLLGRPVELMTIDNASLPLTARQAAKKAVAAGAVAVVGGPFSSLSKAMAEVCQEAGVPFVASISTHPDLTRVGDHVYRVCYTDAQQGEFLARFARDGLGAGTAAVLTNVGSDYSMGLADIFTRSFTAAGGRIVCAQAIKTNDTDFSGQIAAVAAAGPDLVFLPGYAIESGLVIRQATAMGLTATFLGGDGWGPLMAESGGPAMDGHYYATHWHPDSPIPAGRAIANAYRAAHGSGPVQPDAILAHDAVMVLADAIRRAASLDRDAINAALAATRDFPGGAGTITFDADRNPVGKDVCVLRFQNGKAVYHTTFR